MKANRRRLVLRASELKDSVAIDVRFDGHRVWSTAVPAAVEGVVTIPWPLPVAKRLHGITLLGIHDTVTGELLAEETVRFGASRARVAITDKRGSWLAMTKWNRLGPVLEGSDDDVASRLVRSGARVAADMQAWGYPVYLVGGNLLGMVRGGALLPHDDDMDFAYLSDKTDPAELAAESYALERRFTDAGYALARHSLAHLELVFFDDHGQVDHYIDVFTGFFHEGLYCQPFALRGDQVTRDDLVPTADIEVNGVPLPAPANPEAWLAYAYGEGWRVPDPTFRFEVDPGTKQRFESWFGVYNRGRFFWEKHWQGEDLSQGSTGGEGAVRELLDRMPPRSRVLDLGSGDGRWAQELAAAGHTVICVDYSFEALRVAKLNDEHDLVPWRINLNDRAAVLELGANIVDSGEDWYVLCSDLLHGLTYANRENVHLLLSMVLRGAGRAVVTFDTHRTSAYDRTDPRTWFYSVDEFRQELAEAGLSVESLHRGVRRSEVGTRRYARAVIRRAPGGRAERRAWLAQRDEDVA